MSHARLTKDLTPVSQSVARSLLLAASMLTGLAHSQALAPTATSIPDGVLRVCADPNNLPQSNMKGEGYENKIAELMAKDMKRKLEYVWYPQRMGFIRSTLRAKDPDSGNFKCDVVMGVPKEYELTASTTPYMRSTYALVFRNRPELAGVKTAQDLLKLPPDVLKKLRFGIFGRSPAADWLLDNNLFEQATSFTPQSGDPNVNVNSIIEDELRADRIDVAALWGPIAGGFVARDAKTWSMAPFATSESIQFDYEISMGVRFGEKPWKETLEQWIRSHGPQIDAILSGYKVPLLAMTAPAAK